MNKNIIILETKEEREYIYVDQALKNELMVCVNRKLFHF
jgi:hypothetical protein